MLPQLPWLTESPIRCTLRLCLRCCPRPFVVIAEPGGVEPGRVRFSSNKRLLFLVTCDSASVRAFVLFFSTSPPPQYDERNKASKSFFDISLPVDFLAVLGGPWGVGRGRVALGLGLFALAARGSQERCSGRRSCVGAFALCLCRVQSQRKPINLQRSN